ncbi:MAG: protein NO VEIN domain-containing protein [Pseudanabaenaceae cyanobacterium]
MKIEQIKQGIVIRGSIFSEPVKVLTVQIMGNAVKLIGQGLNTNQVHQPVLTPEQIAQLEATPEQEPFDGDAQKFRHAIEAMRLGLAYEYDPFFALTVARVDPLPHQLEAVYDYFLKQPRIRFLLADDPGAGKTVMAGLLLKELKARGLVKRVLIVTPANLTFQWQREMEDKFREKFELVRGDVLRANYGSNPWQDKPQVVTSISWISRVDDAKESLLRSHWDFIIVDEAHKMSAYRSDKKTLAYQVGERLSEMTDHYLLMTATPHKGDPKNFCLFLELLDRDVYGDVKSLEDAMDHNYAPFYLRRTKEALVTFPDSETGEVKKLFTRRIVQTADFQINDDELDFYDELTRYVEDQSIEAARDDSSRGKALGFTMAMLQRRFASSIYAVRRSLERMCEKRKYILENPKAYHQGLIDRKLPDDFDEMTESAQEKILYDLENVVATVNPIALQDEIRILGKLIKLAKDLEHQEVESKLKRLRQLLIEKGFFADPKMKLLIFTEHRDTLDFLAGDGKNDRPLGKLKQWGLSVTQIHGGMKIGDRDTPNTRIYAEREFRENCQVMVATEAAGKGINLQFCWLMINYDIPWNPVRLEQRMGRIHRYGQEKDCLVFNFVSTNTREGSVFWKLFERIQRIEADLDPDKTGKVFNVLGDVFPANQIERMLRDMYARNTTDTVIKDRIVEQVDTEHFQKITRSALEGLAKRELNLSTLIGRSTEAKEKRLVPEVVENFFMEAAPVVGLYPKLAAGAANSKNPNGKIYRVGRVPRHLWGTGDEQESQFGKLGREYKQITFDKGVLIQDSTIDWVTLGHPLFECVRTEVLKQTEQDLVRGAVFYDLQRAEPARLDIYAAVFQDGRGNKLHERLYVVQTELDGTLSIKQPTIFLDLIPVMGTSQVPDGGNLPERSEIERFLVENELNEFLAEVQRQRAKEIKIISAHMERSLTIIIDRLQLQYGELLDKKESGSEETGIDGRLKQAEDRLDELNARLDRRRIELKQENNCTIAAVVSKGRAWVLPHPDRSAPDIAPMVSNAEIERIAVDAVIAYEVAQGWQVESVESENRGFDLISRKPHPEDPKTAIAVKFIEVKGRSHVGRVGLTDNEYRTAERLHEDYWLYVVFNCATQPEVHPIQNPAKLDWEAVMKVKHYQVGADQILLAKKD